MSSARGDVPHAYLETKKILQLREYATEKVMVPVCGGASLEICPAALAANLSAVELTADVEFHVRHARGALVAAGGRTVRLGAADGFARVELSAPLRPSGSAQRRS